VTATTAAPPPTAPVAEQPASGHWRWLWIATVALAVLPIVVAVVRSILDHWVPVGDDAYFVLRSRDVWSSHIPLLGTWTSASLSTGRDINNPGPLFFDALAVPVTVLGGPVGVAVGTGLLNVLSILGIAWCAFRRGGPLLVAVAMLVVSVLTWSMGSFLLFDPWQPHALLLPFLCFVFIAWSLACGDLAALPWAVGLASLITQTHLTYVVLVGALSAWGIVGLVLVLRSRRRQGPRPEGDGRRTVRILVTAAVVAVVCWVQPLFEQVFRGGNLSGLAASGSGSNQTLLGPRHAVQVMANVLSIPPFWSRSGFDHAFTEALGGPHGGPEGIGLASLPGVGASVASLALLLVVIVGIGFFARRRRDLVSMVAAITVLVALAAGLFTAVRIPTDIFGVAAHQFRWLWPLGAFIAFTILAALARAWTASGARRILPAVAVVAALCFVFSVANLPTHDAHAGPAGDRYAIPVVRAMDHQLAKAKIRGPVLLDVHDITFGDPYSAPLMLELQHLGVPFVVTDHSLIHQLGPGRDAAGAGAVQRIFSLTGSRATTYSGPGRRIAYHAGLTRAEQAGLDRLTDQVRADVRAGAVHLSPKGEQLVSGGQFGALATDAGRRDPDALVGPGVLVAADQAGALALEPAVQARVARMAELQQARDRGTVGVFLAPLRS
jgi:hypothetical protein